MYTSRDSEIRCTSGENEVLEGKGDNLNYFLELTR